MDLILLGKQYRTFKFLFKELEGALIALDLLLQEDEFTEFADGIYGKLKYLKHLVDDAFRSIIEMQSLSNIKNLCVDEEAFKIVNGFEAMYKSKLISDHADKVKELIAISRAFKKVCDVFTQTLLLVRGNEDVFLKQFREDSNKEQKLEESLQRFELSLIHSSSDLKELGETLLRSDEKVSKINDKLNEDSAKFQTEFNATLEKLNLKLGEVDVLLGLASNKVISHDYANSARDEKQLADNFRIASIVLISIVTVIFIAVLFESSKFGFEIENSVFKILMGLLLSVPAAYFAKESNRHRSRQHSLHQASLELNTIRPFLEDLPEEDRIKVKSNFANKLFGGGPTEKIEADVIPSNVIELITEIVKKTTQK